MTNVACDVDACGNPIPGLHPYIQSTHRNRFSIGLLAQFVFGYPVHPCRPSQSRGSYICLHWFLGWFGCTLHRVRSLGCTLIVSHLSLSFSVAVSRSSRLCSRMLNTYNVDVRRSYRLCVSVLSCESAGRFFSMRSGTTHPDRRPSGPLVYIFEVIQWYRNSVGVFLIIPIFNVY